MAEWQPMYERRLQNAVEAIWAAQDALGKIGAAERKEANIDVLLSDLKKVGFDLFVVMREKYPD